jgi:hypothetical protein
MKTINRVKLSNFKSGFPCESIRIEKITMADNIRILISINTIFFLREGVCETAIERPETINNKEAVI